MGLWILERNSAQIAMSIEGEDNIATDICSPACLNLNHYPFLNTSSCACDHQGIAKIYQIAASTRAKAVWLIVGVICIMIGFLISIINISADIGCIHMPGAPNTSKNDLE